MRVYVAAPWREKSRAKDAMKLVEWDGHQITHDWTEQEDGEWMDGPEREDYFEQCQAEDVRAVRTADIMLVLHPTDNVARGLFVEVGIAIALGIPVVVVGSARTSPQQVPIFYWNPLVWMVPNLECAVDSLPTIIRERTRPSGRSASLEGKLSN